MAPPVAGPAASQDGDGDPDRRDPNTDGAHDKSESANQVHGFCDLTHSPRWMPHRVPEV